MTLSYTEPNGKVHSLENPSHEGWMTKQSEWIKDWRRRYFILKGSKLFFAKDRNLEPHGMIDLGTCLTVKSAAEIKVKKKYAIELATNDRQVFYMHLSSDQEKDLWLGAIGRSIVQSSGTFIDDNYDVDANSDSGSDD